MPDMPPRLEPTYKGLKPDSGVPGSIARFVFGAYL